MQSNIPISVICLLALSQTKFIKFRLWDSTIFTDGGQDKVFFLFCFVLIHFKEVVSLNL